MDNALYINIFILISLILTAGYFLGRKKNRAVAASAINTLLELMKPERQEITNIGGLVGYHVRMWFDGGKAEEAQGTITMLPRHSLLYLPVSRIFRGFDRFFITIKLKALPVEKQARLFEKRFYYKHRKIAGNNMQVNTLSRNGREFLIFYENSRELAYLQNLFSGIVNPDKLKEISILPGKGVIEILVVPSAGDNRVLGSIIRTFL